MGHPRSATRSSIAVVRLDLPQVDLMNFREEYGMLVRSRSGRASDEVARGRLVSLEEFSFTFRAKNEEWRDLQLVSQITFGRNSDQDNRTCLRFSCASTDQICLLFTNKNT